MGKSYKKHPFYKNNPSSKKDKTHSNRVYRRLCKRMELNEDTLYPTLQEVIDNWTFRSEGWICRKGPERQIIYRRRNVKMVKIIETRPFHRIHRK